MDNPIRVDMSTNDGLGEALLAALLTGRPLVMHDSTRPDIPEVGIGLDLGATDSDKDDEECE